VVEVSIAVPVFNEEFYLPFFIGSVRRCRQLRSIDHEFVFSIDYGTSDRSEEVIRRYMPEARVVHHPRSSWRNPGAANFDFVVRSSLGNIVYALAPDLFIDCRIFDSGVLDLLRSGRFGAVSFRYWNYTVSKPVLSFFRFREAWDNFLKRILQGVWKNRNYHSGIFAFRRGVYEAVGGLRDVPSEYDDFLSRVEGAGFRHLYVDWVDILHLRAGYSRNRQLLQGITKARLGYSFPYTFLGAVLHLKPYQVVGYLAEKHYGMFTAESYRKVWRKGGGNEGYLKKT